MVLNHRLKLIYDVILIISLAKALFFDRIRVVGPFIPLYTATHRMSTGEISDRKQCK